MITVESKKNTLSILNKIAKFNKFSNSTLFYGPNLKNTYSIMMKCCNNLHKSESILEYSENEEIIEPELNKIIINPPGKSIKINIIHQLQKRIQYGNESSKSCVIIIHNIDRLTKTSANALLKTIEAPPENTIFFLSCINKWKVLPTLQSRSQSFFIPQNLLDQENIHKKQIEDLSNEINYISAKEFLKLTEFNQYNFIQKLPRNLEQIELLLNCWTISLFNDFKTLTIKEHKFLEKMIEIISNLNYNLNLKLQLLAIIFKMEED